MKTSKSTNPFIFGLIAIPALLTAFAIATDDQTEQIVPCYNPEEPGVWCEDCKDDIEYSYFIENATSCPTGGVNPVNMASGDVQRAVNDLAANGGAGQHRLHWTRYGHSRLVGGANWFGDGHCWRHSYQWEMTEVASGQIKITVIREMRAVAYAK